MTAIFDEGVPRDLLAPLQEAGSDVVAFPRHWKGTKNGELMKLISDAGFACLITCDKNLPHQQNLTKFRFSVVVLPTNKLDQLKLLIRQIGTVLATAQPGTASWLD